MITERLSHHQEKQQLRESLQGILEKGKLIKRFTGNDLPKGVVNDNVYEHTLRSYNYADNLFLGAIFKDLVKKTLLIHDLPEIHNAFEMGRYYDITAPQKEAVLQLDEQIADEEMKTAQIMFSDNELSLFVQFEESDKFLRGKDSDHNMVSSVGLVARIIDNMDANLLLHLSLSEWAKTSEYNPDLINPKRSLTYAFRQYREYIVALESIPFVSSQPVCIHLLNLQMAFIRSMWVDSGIKQETLPKELLIKLNL